MLPHQEASGGISSDHAERFFRKMDLQKQNHKNSERDSHLD